MSSPDKHFFNFYEACREQEVRLDERLVVAGLRGANNGEEDKNYVPNGMLAAIETAGLLLGSKSRPLANQTIVPDDEVSYDLATSSLIDIINASVRFSTVEPARYSYKSAAINRIATCHRAEIGFLRNFVEMKKVDVDGRVPFGAQIFEANGSPVFVRKHIGLYSALSLEPVSINGIPYPAGSIFAMEFRDEDTPGMEDLSTPNVLPAKLEIFSARAIDGISFLRLSAFALSQAERREVGFRPPPHFEDGEDELYMQAELSDFKDAVAEAKGRLDELVGSVGEVGLQEALAA